MIAKLIELYLAFKYESFHNDEAEQQEHSPGVGLGVDPAVLNLLVVL